MSKCVVLLSGGQDSTTCLYVAKQMFDEVEAVSVRYGQRHVVEVGAAEKIAKLAGVPWREIDGGALSQIGDSALVRPDLALSAEGGRSDSVMPQGLPTSFVPGRNALFLVLAVAHAVSRGSRDVVTGVCQTDYSGYPDCRREFVDAMERALTLALPTSAGPVRIHTPLMHMTKAETVRLARRLPGCWEALALSLTCYLGTRCGDCPACVLRARGFAEVGERDPACVVG